MLGEVYNRKGDLREAENHFEAGFMIDSTNTAIRKSLADLAQKTGQTDTAIRHLEYLAKNTRDPDVLLNLGIAYDRTGHPDSAVEMFEEAVNIDSLSFRAHNNLGRARMGIGRFDEAETSFKRAISIKPDYPTPYYNLANLYRRTGRLKEAQEYERLYQELK
jgi:tetratricopeptide (TPR) repeat protein